MHITIESSDGTRVEHRLDARSTAHLRALLATVDDARRDTDTDDLARARRTVFDLAVLADLDIGDWRDDAQPPTRQ